MHGKELDSVQRISLLQLGDLLSSLLEPATIVLSEKVELAGHVEDLVVVTPVELFEKVKNNLRDHIYKEKRDLEVDRKKTAKPRDWRLEPLCIGLPAILRTRIVGKLQVRGELTLHRLALSQRHGHEGQHHEEASHLSGEQGGELRALQRSRTAREEEKRKRDKKDGVALHPKTWLSQERDAVPAPCAYSSPTLTIFFVVF